MPIKPENAARYPKDWPEVRARILARAGNCCEGSPDFPDCRAPNGWYRIKGTEEVIDLERWQDVWKPEALTRIVLTIGHLNHVPEDCADANLRAWCQRCHLNYDAKHHAQTAAGTRKARKACGDLFQ